MTTKYVEVVDYNAKWATDFISIKQELLPVINDIAIAIEHVGSTAVQGLAAKPIIDIDIVIDSPTELDKAILRLGSIGYTHEGDLGIYGRAAFKYEGKPHLQEHHLYVCAKNAEELKRHVTFRDYLRTHPMAVERYGKVKKEGALLFPYDIDGYVEYKTDCIMALYKECGLI